MSLHTTHLRHHAQVKLVVLETNSLGLHLRPPGDLLAGVNLLSVTMLLQQAASTLGGLVCPPRPPGCLSPVAGAPLDE